MYLIIGGTKFLGRHLVDSLLARGYEVALFNRGRHAAGDMPDIEVIHGDRNLDLDKLKGRKWKAVIDTCGYLPQTVRTSAEFFADSTETYVFISSISAYADFSKPDFDETTRTAELSEEQQERAGRIDPSQDITALVLKDLYGGLKAKCERAAEEAVPGRVLIIRPGLIVGPFDPTNRFTYWVMRIAKGGDVLAPGSPGRFVQLIDARDLADWTVKMAENRATGICNATGKPFEMTMGRMLESIRNTMGSDASFRWADGAFLHNEGVKPWSEMPLYLPEGDENSKGFLSVNVEKAINDGLVFRSFEETISDTFAWRSSVPGEMKAGISAARERELLEKLGSR
jgi:2'-hydroxyisoflavone reductase